MSSYLVESRHYPVSHDTQVLSVQRHAVTLERTKASARPGVYGLVWNGGHAVLGGVLAVTSTTVTRELSAQRGRLANQRVGIDSNVWETDPDARGIAFQTVQVPGPLGPMPAWFVPSSGSTWAIYVHGINGDRAAGLRILPTVRRAGYPSLLISLRNDVGAPGSPDGHVHLGMTEWRDLEAAVRYAIARGARGVLLIGYSMGATIAGRFMLNSRLATTVRGMVFDSPVVNWRSAISFATSRYHVPFMARPVEWAVSARIDIDWDALDLREHRSAVGIPTLLFQGLEDQQVPPSQSAALARAFPQQITYAPTPRADHLESWNVDPRRYNRRVKTFLRTHR
jgi:pimeloyl-ACP methyl ester carboxylesterase